MVIGLILVGLGVLFLASRIFDFSLIGMVWPLFIIVPGALFFVGMLMGGKAAGPLAVPGSIVTMTGLILMYQSIFNVFETWAYVWSLIFPTAVGLGLIISGTWSGDSKLVQTGIRWTTVGLIIFLIMGAFFELLLNFSDNPLSDVLWPGLLIGLGIWLLRRRSASPNGKVHEPVITVERVPQEPPAPRAAPRPQAAQKPPVKPITPEPPSFEPIDPERGRRRRKPTTPDTPQE